MFFRITEREKSRGHKRGVIRTWQKCDFSRYMRGKKVTDGTGKRVVREKVL